MKKLLSKKKRNGKPVFDQSKKSSKFKKKGNFKPKLDPRKQILTKQLRNLGKVGAVIDKRIGIKGAANSSSDVALRRHIIEKLRQMETFGTAATDSDDLFTKHTGNKNTRASYDDELGGLSADIVNSELFTGGEDENFTQPSIHRGGHDDLLDKIAATKVLRLKRAEENEEQKKKLKNVDNEWTDKVRFMLSKFATLKPKNNQLAAKLEKSKKEVMNLLGKLSSHRTVAPVGARVETEAMKTEKLLANLENIVSNKLNSGTCLTNEQEKFKSEDLLLRLLSRIPAYESTTVASISQELYTLELTNLADVVRGLLLSHILIELVLSKLHPQFEGPENKFTRPERLSGTFIPELVQFLIKLVSLSSKTNNSSILRIESSMNSVAEPMYGTLDIRLGTRQAKIPEDSEKIKLLSLSCLNRLIHLCQSLLDVYSEHFPLPSVIQTFSKMSFYLGKKACNLPLSHLPSGLRERVVVLSETLESMKSKRLPADLVTVDKVSLLLSNKEVTSKVLQEAGIVPLLEPRFEEKLDARRPKKRAANVDLRQKLAKEKRGVGREIRRDAQFLANYDLQQIKSNDKMRNEKTQAIINSMRSIE